MKILTVSAATFHAHSAVLPEKEIIQFGASLPEGLRLRAPLAVNIERAGSTVLASVAGFSVEAQSTGAALEAIARRIVETYRSAAPPMDTQTFLQTYIDQPDSQARSAAKV
jgi:hypothetical protein